MAAPRETEQGHELSDLAPVVVRGPSPFLTTALARPLPPIPELPGSPVPTTSTSSSYDSLPSLVPYSSSPSVSPSPEPTADLRSVCCICLAHKAPDSLLCGDPSDPRFPLASRCLDCVDQSPEGLDLDMRYPLVSGDYIWVCRWCGRAGLVPSDWSWDGVEFHEDGCRAGYARALRDHWVTLALQWFILWCLGFLCFGSFSVVGEVKVECFVLFLATSFSSIFGFWRFKGRNVYCGPLLMEMNRLLALVGLLYYVVRTSFYSSNVPMEEPAAPEDGSVDEVLEDNGDQASSYRAAATISLIVWLLIHALFSCIGHLIVFYEWKWWRRMRPGMSFWRRMVEGFMFKMVIWADPSVVDQGFPPRWWRGLGHRVSNDR
ncbi:hypothetical protein MKX07_008904 [Trichoderma sp. CBMAI-0711]|nr:hypothetical protein MKX07_008904 [Trichoderma sp. CBMAI-0711]